MVPFWVSIIIRHLLFRVPQEGTLILTTTHMSGLRTSGLGCTLRLLDPTLVVRSQTLALAPKAETLTQKAQPKTLNTEPEVVGVLLMVVGCSRSRRGRRRLKWLVL